MSEFWQACLESFNPQALGGTAYRIVESQKIVATRSLVDDPHEQQMLEDLLENNKPGLNEKLQSSVARLDYLLWTPFRYPPLVHGSRFSTRFEPSLFYAARKISTALAEAAFYRYFFWSGMREAPPSGKLETQHTVFSAKVFTPTGAKLQMPPFDQHQSALTDKQDYKRCQQLGQALREIGVKAFEFISARDPDKGLNLALFTPEVFKSRRPETFLHVVCSTTADEVVFLDEKNNKFVFPYTDFLADGQFPQPGS